MPNLDHIGLDKFELDAQSVLKTASKIRFQEPFFNAQSKSKRWNNQLKNALSDYKSALQNARSDSDIFFGMCQFEKNCSKVINSVPHDLDENKTLSSSANSLDTLNVLNNMIKSINLVIADNINTVIDSTAKTDPDSSWNALKNIASKIQIDTTIAVRGIGSSKEAEYSLNQIALKGIQLVMRS